MQGSRFDALTRWTSRRVTRRTAVSQLGTGLAAAFGLANLGARSVTAQVATPMPEASPAAVAMQVSLLFVQHAGPTTLTPGTGNIHTLTMTEVPAQTLYFSDRPNRVAGAEPTASFVDGFAEAFAASPPNASLIGHVQSGDDQEEAVVLTLLSAAYDEAATLTYEVTLIDAELASDVAFEREPLTVLDAPRAYAEASLFIDGVDAPVLTGTQVLSYHITPEEDCPNYSPDFMCDVAKCEGTGPGPCGGQGTNCCDQVCDWLGSTSQYATYESCVDTDGVNSTALWSCECA